MPRFNIERVESTVYLDNSGKAINGYRIYVHLNEYDETHDLNVPNIQEATVKKAVDTLLTRRDALSKLQDVEAKK